MTKIILVSLIHDRKPLISDCITSAINQTLPKEKWMHLLIDNHSTDGADVVAEAFTKNNPHIRLHRMAENLGQQKAFNWMLNEWIPKNAPEAEILANLDSDDTIMPFALAEIEKMFDGHPEIGAAYSGFNIIDGKNRLTVKNHGKAKMVPNQFTPEGQKQLRRMFIMANPCGHMRSFRLKCLRDIGGFNTSYTYATDYNVFGRMLTKYPVVKIDKVLYNFRQHKFGQVERQQSPAQTADWKNMQQEFKNMWFKMGII